MQTKAVVNSSEITNSSLLLLKILMISVRNYRIIIYSQDIGAGKGKYYAVNFPLRDGIDDDSYEQIFNPVRIS